MQICRAPSCGSIAARSAAVRPRPPSLKEARVRRDHQFKLAHRLASEIYLIAIEDLSVKVLAEGRLAKDCRDAAWGQFARSLADKAEEAGRMLLRVNSRNTSQVCYGWGALPAQGKTLAMRTHVCDACGLMSQRHVKRL